MLLLGRMIDDLNYLKMSSFMLKVLNQTLFSNKN